MSSVKTGISKTMFAVGLAVAKVASSLIASTVSMQYAKGPKGDKGDTGVTGPAGSTGATGPLGPQGSPGFGTADYDSGWINITDKRGQDISILHDLNSTDIKADIVGKRTLESGIHQRQLGGTDYMVEMGKTYGGKGTDRANTMIQTVDGDYALAGYTNPFGVGCYDAWLIKTDASGSVLWSKTYGRPTSDYAFSVVQTGDGGYALGGYALAGYTYSFGAGGYDAWLVKTDAYGIAEWFRDWFKHGWHGSSPRLTA